MQGSPQQQWKLEYRNDEKNDQAAKNYPEEQIKNY